MDSTARNIRLARGGLVTPLLATVLVVPLLLPAGSGAWRGVKPILFEILALALVGLALIRAMGPWSRQRVVEWLRAGPNLPVLLFLLYGAASWCWSSSPGYSSGEWVRLACGAGLCFVVPMIVRRRDQVKRVVDALMAVAVVTSLFGLAAYSQPGATSIDAAFGNKQLFAGFLLLLLPLLLVLAFSEVGLKYRIPAQGAALLSVVALLLAQNRSSWLGMAVALVALIGMALSRTSRHELSRLRHQWIVPVVIVGGAVGLFLTVTRTTPVVTARATTLAATSRDHSLAWRLGVWRGAWQLIRERPLFGWGIGTFPLEQARTVPGAWPRDLVRRWGPTLAEEAHNEYIQVAAEMGVIGLGLHLWILGAFFGFGLRTLREREPGYRRRVLMGCLAGLAGQTVDALANPAWRCADVSWLFWLMMGLGMAAARAPRPAVASGSGPGEGGAAAAAARGAGRRTWQVAALALTLLTMGGAWAKRGFCPLPMYHDVVEIHIAPEVVMLHPGECVQFKVTATTGDGLEDVTEARETRFFTEPEQVPCLTNNASVNAKLTAKKSLFCVPPGPCPTLGCGSGRVVQVFVSFGRVDVRARAVVNVVCP